MGVVWLQNPKRKSVLYRPIYVHKKEWQKMLKKVPKYSLESICELNFKLDIENKEHF